MTALARQQALPADPIAAFTAQCEVRAMLYARGELELIEAVDALQASPKANCLVDMIGQDAVQLAMAQSFEAVRVAEAAELPSNDPLADLDDDEAPSDRSGIPISTRQAAEWLYF